MLDSEFTFTLYALHIGDAILADYYMQVTLVGERCRKYIELPLPEKYTCC